jgi:hypothetical protein
MLSHWYSAIGEARETERQTDRETDRQTERVRERELFTKFK